MNKAFQYNDYFAFKRFVGLYPSIYLLAGQYISDSLIVKQVTERCGILIAEFAHYYIEPKIIEDSLQEEDIKELFAYAKVLVVTFSQLAKNQIDRMDEAQFELTVKTIRRLLSRFSTKYDTYKLYYLEQQIDYSRKNDQTELTLTKEKERTLILLSNKFINLRQSALFGLGAWICHLIDIGKITSDNFKKFLEPLGKEFDTIVSLVKAYISAISSEDRQSFNWNSWEMDEWKDEAYGEGKFGAIAFSSWIDLYLTYHAIELIPSDNNITIVIEPLPEIKGILDTTTTNINYFYESKNWSFLRSDITNLELRRQNLESILKIAHEKQTIIDELNIIKSPLSQTKINNFIIECKKAWQENGNIRNLFDYFGKYICNPNLIPTKKLIPFGLHVRIPKSVFLEDTGIGYPMLGESYGRSLSQGESLRIIDYFKKFPRRTTIPKKFEAELIKQISALRANGYSPVILYGHELHKYIFESSGYEPYWQANKKKPEKLRNLEGYYKDIPVFRHSSDARTLFICDFSKFGTLIQYKVSESISDFPLQILIKEITAERAKDYLDKPKLSPKTTGTDSSEEYIRKIQQDVELAIWQNFDIEDIDFKAGVVIKVREQLIKMEGIKKD